MCSCSLYQYLVFFQVLTPLGPNSTTNVVEYEIVIVAAVLRQYARAQSIMCAPAGDNKSLIPLVMLLLLLVDGAAAAAVAEGGASHVADAGSTFFFHHPDPHLQHRQQVSPRSLHTQRQSPVCELRI